MEYHWQKIAYKNGFINTNLFHLHYSIIYSAYQISSMNLSKHNRYESKYVYIWLSLQAYYKNNTALQHKCTNADFSLCELDEK